MPASVTLDRDCADVLQLLTDAPGFAFTAAQIVVVSRVPASRIDATILVLIKMNAVHWSRGFVRILPPEPYGHGPH